MDYCNLCPECKLPRNEEEECYTNNCPLNQNTILKDLDVLNKWAYEHREEIHKKVRENTLKYFGVECL